MTRSLKLKSDIPNTSSESFVVGPFLFFDKSDKFFKATTPGNSGGLDFGKDSGNLGSLSDKTFGSTKPLGEPSFVGTNVLLGPANLSPIS